SGGGGVRLNAIGAGPAGHFRRSWGGANIRVAGRTMQGFIFAMKGDQCRTLLQAIAAVIKLRLFVLVFRPKLVSYMSCYELVPHVARGQLVLLPSVPQLSLQ